MGYVRASTEEVLLWFQGLCLLEAISHFACFSLFSSTVSCYFTTSLAGME